MKIIILGAGQVGSSVAEILAREANDITVVDLNQTNLQELQDRLDIRTIVGHGSHPNILARAGAEDADMIIAVTDSDETNMIACQIAYSLFHTPTKIARVRSTSYLSLPQLFTQEAIPVDVLISPEQVVIEHVARLIEYPGALQIHDFADGRVRLVAIKAFHGGPLVGHELHELSEHMPNVKTRVAAIFRHGASIALDGKTIIEADDEVFFIAATEHIRAVMSELRRADNPIKRITLVGGGQVGRGLAARLENQYQVRLIEKDEARAQLIAEQLDKTLVLTGDAADSDLFIEENIENTDIFCAITNDDETNILSAMLAKKLGAKKVMTLINRSAYVDLVESSDIDIAISPQQATIGSLLALVRRGDVVVVHSLRRGAAEAIEAVAHGDANVSKVVGSAIEDIQLPHGTTIAAIVRGDEVIIAHHDTVIEAEDHVILFLVDKKHITEVEQLFQVGFGFI